MSQQNPPPHEDAIDQGINKYMVKIQGLIIPSLLAIIGWFVCQTLLTVNQIAADNQRFNTYMGTNNLRVDAVERGLSEVQAEQVRQRSAQLAGEKKAADEWSDFWRNYGFMFHVNAPRAAKPTR